MPRRRAPAEEEAIEESEEEEGEEEEGEEEEGEEEEESDEDDEEEEEEEEELDLDEMGRVAVVGAVDYRTRCFDGAVVAGSASVASALCADCEAVFTARANDDGEGLSSGTTFWASAAGDGADGGGAGARSALEALALEIFAFHARGVTYDPCVLDST
jgi:hypothetical protein